MTAARISLYCPACRRFYPLSEGRLSCPRTQPGSEHALRKIVRLEGSTAPMRSRIVRRWREDRSPFVIFRDLLAARELAGDHAYLELLDGFESRLRKEQGRSFTVTPLEEASRLNAALNRQGPLWVKNDSGNVGGSHKARHLMGTLLYLEALRRRSKTEKPVLAVYSCGNAALGAAVIARAGGYRLHAFVPDDVNPVVEDQLHAQQAVVEKFSRPPGGTGDPCYLAFRRAVEEHGWIPFSCSGNDNWSNIDGGTTLGWETVMQLREARADVAAVIVQVGGGALGRSVAQAWREAAELGLVSQRPPIYACQPEGGFPFVRAYLLVLQEVARLGGPGFDLAYRRRRDPRQQLEALKLFSWSRPQQIRRAARYVRDHFSTPAVQDILRQAARHRDRFMWPWDGPPPQSAAHGILDDETYDWYDLLLAVLETGGRAVILPESGIEEAHRLARRHTSIAVCATGSSGLAGLQQLEQDGDLSEKDSVQLFFTGLDRGSSHESS